MKKFVFVALCFVLLFSFASAKTVEIWSWRTQDAQVWQEVQKNLKAKGEDITIDFHYSIHTTLRSVRVFSKNKNRPSDHQRQLRVSGLG